MTYSKIMNPGKGNNPRQLNQKRVQTVRISLFRECGRRF